MIVAVAHDGKLVSLNRFKDMPKKSVKKGFERISTEDYNDIKRRRHYWMLWEKAEIKR